MVYLVETCINSENFVVSRLLGQDEVKTRSRRGQDKKMIPKCVLRKFQYTFQLGNRIVKHSTNGQPPISQHARSVGVNSFRVSKLTNSGQEMFSSEKTEF